MRILFIRHDSKQYDYSYEEYDYMIVIETIVVHKMFDRRFQSLGQRFAC